MAAVKKTPKQNGYGEKQTVRIITVDKERRRVECAMRDGAMIWAAIWETDTVFRWPEVGEIWTVRQDTGIWRLDQIVQSPLAEQESSATPVALENLPEGDTRVIGNSVHMNSVTIEGHSLGWASAIPTEGTWTQGDILFKTSPTSSGFVGWVCVTSGSPGVWKTFGVIS